MIKYNKKAYNKFYEQNIKSIYTLAKYHYTYIEDKTLYNFEDFLQECLLMIWLHFNKYGLYSIKINNIIKKTVLTINKER